MVPGITAVPTDGHTPGHLSFRVLSGDERALILGDAIHCPLQISHPEWAFMADTAPDAARRAREQLLRELDEPGMAVVGPHFPDAVFGAWSRINRPPFRLRRGPARLAPIARARGRSGLDRATRSRLNARRDQ